jgi:hypothetical protein
MRTLYLRLLLIISFSSASYAPLQAQVKIGTSPQTINSASILELESSNKAFVIPRMNSVQMSAITPLEGAMVYNTDEQCMHYYDGAAWINICEAFGNSFSITNDAVVNSSETILIQQTDNNYNLEVGLLNASNIQDGTMGTAKIVDLAVTVDKLAVNSVNNSKIQNRTIQPGKLAQGTAFQVLQTNLAGSAAIWATLDGSNITGSLLSNEQNATGTGDTSITVTNGDGATLKATQLRVTDSGITTIKLANDAVDNTKLADNAVQTLNIFNGTILEEDLADNAVTNIKIIDNAVGTLKIQDDAVTAAKINGDVAGIGLQQNTITGALEINPATVTGDGDITSTDLIVTGGTDAAFNDVTLTIADNAVTAAKINTDVAGEGLEKSTTTGALDVLVDNTTIQIDATNGLQVIPNGITLTQIANNAVTTAKIEDLTIVNEDIADRTISRLKLANGGAIGDILRWDGTNWVLANESALSITEAQNLANVLSFGTDANATTITNLGAPTNNDDAATKVYVDTQITANAADGSETEITIGGINSISGNGTTATPYLITATEAQTLTNVLALGANANATTITNLGAPTNNDDAATKVYVDTQITANAADGSETEITIGGINSISGNGTTATPYLITATEAQTLTNVLALGADANATTITNLGAPTNNNDAATKVYVDTQITANAADGSETEITIGGINSISGNGTTATPYLITATEAQTLTNVLALGADANATTITNLGAPTNNDDAATKVYVDTQISANAADGSETEINIGGINSISGNGTTATPYLITATEAQTLTNVLALGANANATTITNLGAPTNNDDAATKVYVDNNSLNLAADDLTQTNATNRDYNLNNGNLVFSGAGNVGIGTFPLSGPVNKLHVAGAIRSEGILNSNGTNGEPSYRFNGDADTGMYRIAADEIGFSVGGLEALNINETSNTTTITIREKLKLDGSLEDVNNSPGTIGQILSSTGTGTAWINPAVVAMGKANGGTSLNVNGATVTGSALFNTISVNFLTPRPNANYIIQLTVRGDNRIFVTGQTNTNFNIEIRTVNTNTLVVAEWFFTITDF